MSNEDSTTLEFQFDEEFLQLKREYLDSLKKNLSETEEVIKNSKITLKKLPKQVAFWVHSASGSGGTYGYTIISEICRQFENELVAEIELNRVLQELQSIRFLKYLEILQEITRAYLNENTTSIEIEKIVE